LEIAAQNSRGRQRLGNDLDIANLEVLATHGVGALHNDGLRAVGSRNSIPAGVGYARVITRVVGIDISLPIQPLEVPHNHGRIILSALNGSRTVLCLSAALVNVCLGNVDGEGNVVDVVVLPRNVLCPSLTTNPGLESSTIDRVDGSDVGKKYILHRGKLCLILTERTN